MIATILAIMCALRCHLKFKMHIDVELSI